MSETSQSTGSRTFTPPENISARANLGPEVYEEAAADRLREALWREGVLPFPAEARALLAAAADGAAPVWGLDSIGLVAPSDVDARGVVAPRPPLDWHHGRAVT